MLKVKEKKPVKPKIYAISEGFVLCSGYGKQI